MLEEDEEVANTAQLDKYPSASPYALNCWPLEGEEPEQREWMRLAAKAWAVSAKAGQRSLWEASTVAVPKVSAVSAAMVRRSE